MGSFFHWNINGLKGNADVLNQQLGLLSPDIVCLNETKLGDSPAPSLQGYQVVSCKERSCSFGGGVAIFCKEDIDMSEVATDIEDTCAGSIVVGKKVILVICTYWSKQTELDHDKIDQLIGRYEHCIMMGDFNARSSLWGAGTTDQKGRRLEGLMDRHELILLNDINQPTNYCLHKHSSSLLDLAICTSNLSKMIFDCNVQPPLTGHTMFHVPLLLRLKHAHRPKQQPKREVYSVEKCDWERFRYLLNESIQPLKNLIKLDKSSLDQVATSTGEILRSAFEASCPKKIIVPQLTRVSESTLAMIREKRKVFRLMKKNPDRHELRTTYYRLTRELKRELRKEQENRYVGVTNQLDPRDGKKYWAEIKRLTTSQVAKKTSPTLLCSDGVLSSNPEKVANTFAQTLGNAHKVHTGSNFDSDFQKSTDEWVQNNHNYFKPNFSAQNHSERGDDSCMLIRPTKEELNEKLLAAKSKTSPGEDKVTYNIISESSDSFKEFLGELYGTCITVGYFPKPWKEALGIMIPKKDKEPWNPKNYRPISLLSCIGKILERILSDRLTKFLQRESIINDWQRAYLQKKEGSEHIYKISAQLKKAQSKKMASALLLLDVEKAFDSVWQNGLRRKLHDLGLPTKMMRVLSSFMSDRTIKVRVGNIVSEAISLFAGTPQGSVLSPLLFLIYVNDLPVLPTSNLSQFADDMGFYVHDKNQNRVQIRIQKQIDALEKWCNKWHIKLNATKTQLLAFKNSQKPMQVKIYDCIINSCQHATLLGTTFDSRLNVREHIRRVHDRANARLNMLRVLKGWKASREVLRHTYLTFIRPVMENGYHYSLLASPNIFKPLQIIQNKALRIILGAEMRTPIRCLHEHAELPMIREHLEIIQDNAITRYGESNLMLELVEKLYAMV